MDVWIKDFDVEMKLKNNGIELHVADPNGGGHRGDLYINKARLEWCEGKTHRGGGRKIKWSDFITYMESQP